MSYRSILRKISTVLYYFLNINVYILVNNEIQTELKKPINYQSAQINVNNEVTSINNYCEFVQARLRNFYTDCSWIFCDSHVRKWSIWWALTTCGDLQVSYFINFKSN